MVDDDGIDGIVRAAHAGDSVEIIEPAIHRFEMGLISLLYPNGVEQGIGLHEEDIHILSIADGERETIGVDLLIDDDGIETILPRGRDGERIGQRGHPAHELIIGIDCVVQRAIYARTGSHQRHHKQHTGEKPRVLCCFFHIS